MNSFPGSPTALLQRLVSINSVNATISGRPDAEAELVEYLSRLASERGWIAKRFDIPGGGANLLMHLPVIKGLPWLLFDSHLDTVGVEGMPNPFHPEIRESRLYGRGACDTKGTGAAMIWALHEYMSDTTRPNNIALLFSSDEENGKTGARHFATHTLPSLGIQFSGAIIGEPTDLKPVLAHNGYVRWKIETRGIACHSSAPEKGISSIRHMIRVIDAIETKYITTLPSKLHSLTGAAQCSINVIRGGSQVNIIPDHCEIEIDRRLIPGESAGAVLHDVEMILEKLRTEIPFLDVQQKSVRSDPPLAPKNVDPFFHHIRRCLEAEGLSSEAAGAPYTTNASTYAEAGIPSVVIGPGDIAQAHTTDEYLSLVELEKGIALYKSLMNNPLGCASPSRLIEVN